jgi:gluconokinase
MTEPSGGEPRLAIVLMGVAGAGKTTVGRALAETLGWTFVDADDHHPEENRRLMEAGVPLTDAQRDSWIGTLEALIADHLAAGEPLVLACSALRGSHRRRLREAAAAAGGEARLAFLALDASVARERVLARRDHYMPAELVESQYASLEPPADALSLDATLPPDELVGRIRRSWGI